MNQSNNYMNWQTNDRAGIPMQRSTSLFAILLVCAVVLSGCAGGSPKTSSTTTAPKTIVQTVTQEGTTAPGTTTTQTVTTTETSTAPATTTASSSSSTSTGPGGSNPGGDPDDTLPPSVTAINPGTPGQTTLAVSWFADDPDGAVDPIVKSQIQSAVDVATPIYSSENYKIGKGTQSDTLRGLTSCTAYKFRIHAVDNALTPHDFTSAAVSFTTNAGPALAITGGPSGVTFTNVLDDRITIKYTAVGADDMNSLVQYGTTTGYGSASATQEGPGAKEITITGLSANTDYHINVKLMNHCATANTVNSGDKVNHTAVLVGVDILGNSGPLSFGPTGATTSGIVSVPKATPLVFSIRNKDTTVHAWEIVGQSYSSGNIAAGATVKVPASITLAQGTYDMRCTIHTTMTGKITAS